MEFAQSRIGFKLIHESTGGSSARCGLVETRHGNLETPVFMPVATTGTIKGILPRDLSDIGAKIILGNTYHLWLRPGIDQLNKVDGLRKWMKWDGPLLTDSGGFQVFSLAKLRKIQKDGVEFQSHLDGAKLFMSPEKSIEIQEAIQSTIMMVLDVCPALPATTDQLKDAIDMSTLWARRCLEYRSETSGALFAIAQGGLDVKLRKTHLKELSEMSVEKNGQKVSFDGYALGGFSVGEPMEEMYKVLPDIVPSMPVDKPRYLMGVGTPWDLLHSVKNGLDMFDCVMPTRNARNAYLFTSNGVFRAKQAAWKNSEKAIDENCQCYACKNFSRSYLRHLFNAGHLTASVLATLHNLHFYVNYMKKVRQQIRENLFEKFMNEELQVWRASL